MTYRSGQRIGSQQQRLCIRQRLLKAPRSGPVPTNLPRYRRHLLPKLLQLVSTVYQRFVGGRHCRHNRTSRHT
ncbi:Uncharacterised protein [Mycobacteroides abscessus subsp. abscessus]|nr:Uncharacterised protein [Mycobacteroides abscessus subsp. abscessus]